MKSGKQRGYPNHTHVCACGKRAFASRKTARRARNARLAAEKGMGVYECQVSTLSMPAWHLGHLNPTSRDNPQQQARREPVRYIPPPWACQNCGSDRWIGWRNGPAHEGWRRYAQCVPCGLVQPLPENERNQ